jgi:NADH-quinone oxidoreductase subunit B
MRSMGAAAPEAAGRAVTTTCDRIFAWARRSALWPLPLGLACCAVEMMPLFEAGQELGGLEPGTLGQAPERSDVLIVAGTVSEKMAPLLRQLWEQMPAPRWVIAMGACASCGGPYRTYAVTQGIDRVIPVDVFVSGCPPRLDTLLCGLLHLEKKIGRRRGAGPAR